MYLISILKLYEQRENRENYDLLVCTFPMWTNYKQSHSARLQCNHLVFTKLPFNKKNYFYILRHNAIVTNNLK